MEVAVGVKSVGNQRLMQVMEPDSGLRPMGTATDGKQACWWRPAQQGQTRKGGGYDDSSGDY